MEVLAPAGSPDGLVAAIKGGCDAVYLGGRNFGARAFADNFSDAELEGAIAYAHEHGVKVYVTVNTIIKNSEMQEAVSFVQFLKDIHADAVIVQDLGLLRSISHIPISKHASTQMGIQSSEGLKWCADNGISRAVLSRELTFDELKEVVKGSPVETEVFVQGAMCYCISGGCLFSSIVGGRSGNRGECAQPCRKKYTSNGKEGYLLSNADMYCIDYLEKLKGIGITSVKIEGRMRSTAYAYLASRSYSLANKDPTNEELEYDTSLLKTVFNRGFCHGYMDGVKSLVQSTYPDNRGMFLGNVEIKNQKFRTRGLDLGVKDGVSVFKNDEKIGGFKILNDGDTVTAPFRISDGMYDLYRTYDPRLDKIKNLVGRAPRFEGRKKHCAVTVDLPKVERNYSKTKLSFYVSSIKLLEAVLPYADRIYFDSDELTEASEICSISDVELVYMMPRFSPKEHLPTGNIPLMVNNPGQYRAAKGSRTYGSYVMNFFNSAFPDIMEQTTLSVELSKTEMRDVVSRYPGKVEYMVFGRTELMVTRDPHLGNGCIKDEKGYSFPVYRDRFDYAHILNSSDLMLINYVDDLEKYGVDSLGIDLRKRPTELATLVGKAFKERNQSYTERIRQMCGGTLNTGHYLRGV
ncbi:MAG: U32 family peptidase [Candidatus Methanomethylophilaceae archaeon]